MENNKNKDFKTYNNLSKKLQKNDDLLRKPDLETFHSLAKQLEKNTKYLTKKYSSGKVEENVETEILENDTQNETVVANVEVVEEVKTSETPSEVKLVEPTEENVGNTDDLKPTETVEEIATITTEEVKPVEITTEENVQENKEVKDTSIDETKKETTTEVKVIVENKDVISNHVVRQKAISEDLYVSEGKTANKKFNVFSSLGMFKTNTDLFYDTKDTLDVVIKTLYTPEEINDLIEKTKSNDLKDLKSKIISAMKHPTKNLFVNDAADDIVSFMSNLRNGNIESIKIKEDNKFAASQLQKFDNGPEALVRSITRIYGDNRYFNKVNAYINTMSPLYVSFEEEKEGNEKFVEIEEYIKNTYNYKFHFNGKDKVNKLTRTISLPVFKKKMNNSVNMLYSVAKTMQGSKNITLKFTRKLLDKNETNDFLTKKNFFNNYIGVKYNVIDIEQKVSKIFKAHAETISDIVSTLTTIFMARFVFDYKYFSEIERDLTEQAANKMKYLSFSKDPNEDYWVNELITERLKLNITQVCASNNITNANQLIDIYNKNGTKLVHPEKITSIDDLVFALQYSVNEKVDNKKLDNVEENTLKAVKKLKNKKQKVKKPTKERKNKYLDELRKTDLYKEYYKKYLDLYSTIDLDNQDIKANETILNIKKSTQNNIKTLEDLSTKNLEKKDENILLETIAANDVVDEIIKDAENNETKDNTEEDIKDETKGNTTKPIEPVKPEEVVKPVETSEFNGKNLDKIMTKYPLVIRSEDNSELSKLIESIKNETKSIPESSVYVPFIVEEEPKKEVTIFTTAKNIKKLSEEELKNKVSKYFYKTIHGANGKVGVVGEKLSYRIIEKKSKKNDSKNDSERLDDLQFKKANKLRDEKINSIIGDLVNNLLDYFNENKENLPDDMNIAKLSLNFVKSELNIEEGKTFTLRDLKNCLAVLITESVNPELKELNLELYTGKKTYKNYQNNINNLIKGEE